MQILYRKFSIYELLTLFIPSSFFCFITSIAYLQNIEMQKIIEQNIKINQRLVELTVRYDDIILQLENKTKELDILKETLNVKLATSQLYQATLLLSSNEMRKFYIMYVGGAFIAIFIILPLLPGSGVYWGAFKSFISKSLVAGIPTYTPFLQTKQTFLSFDSINGLDIKYTLINNKEIITAVKHTNASDFVSLSDYIAAIISNSNTVALLTSPTNNVEQLYDIAHTSSVIEKLASIV